jgi:OmpA family
MDRHVSKSVGRMLAVVFAAILPVALSAQVNSTPSGKNPYGDPPSQWDIFLGYSYLAPKATVGGVSFHPVNMGAIGSISRYFNKNLGITIAGDEHYLRPEDGVVTETQPQNDFSGISGGIIGRFPSTNNNLTPFLHGLVGAERAGSYGLGYGDVWGPVITIGGGLDVETPAFNHHLAIRVFQADYQWTRESFPSTGAGPGINGPSYPAANVNMIRLSAGIVIHAGSLAPPVPVTLACAANPDSVFPGDPVTITATAGGLDPKLNAVYSFTGEGVTGSGSTATVATASLAPGTHTVDCMVKEGKPGKEGLKPGQSASSSATFTVKAFEPPTISCSANPTTIRPGDTSTITSTAMSPQNRPLTYSYSASAGTISGSGNSATYSSAGAPTGVVGITCNVSDDKGHTATANTSVTIEAPPVPPAPHTQALCSISFSTDKRRPTRVDNEAKACLDQVALDLQQQPDAKAVVVGESTTAEKTPPRRSHRPAKGAEYAAQRAVNAKEYLVTDKGIDASRISAATGTSDSQTVEDYLVPAGASFSADVPGTTPVDESVIKPQVRKPLGVRPAHHHKAAASSAKPQ